MVSKDKIINEIAELLSDLAIEEKIEAINDLRLAIHEQSPFKKEPVDMVFWIKNTKAVANDYNPNSVAPPEMLLLEKSITEDGYTQPIVSFPAKDGGVEVIDGFHRHRVGKESKVISERVYSYLPIVKIKKSQEDRSDRIASTIRHNRARGKHKVDSMSEIVIELKRRNWSDKKIGSELGMDADEVLRLTQIQGLAEMFQDKDFSEAWRAESMNEREIEGVISEED